MAYEPYQALHLAIPETFNTVSSWDNLTPEEIERVLDVLRDELQEVDFSAWYSLVSGFSELTSYGTIYVNGRVNSHDYGSTFPMTELTPRALELYRLYARNHIFRYQGVHIGDNAMVGKILSILGASYEGMSLSTEEVPYGLTLMNVDMTSEEILSTSAFIFILVPNADWITYEVANGEIAVRREQLADFLGESQFENETQLLALLQERFEREVTPYFLEVQ
jgi:hypothetical protein